MDKYKLLVCPTDIASVPIARYADMLHDYELQAVISPAGWGLNDKDISIIDGGSKKGVLIYDNIENHIGKCDVVLISKSYKPVNFEGYILPTIKKSLEKGKKVLLSLDEKGNEAQKIEKILEGSRDIEYISKNNDMKLLPENIQQELKAISTPIILVAGLGDRCNKFETQLSIRRTMINMGYKVCQLGTKEYSSLFGFRKMPDFLLDESYSMEDRIYLFNQYIFNLEKEYNPDVFIIGVPGGIMPFDDVATNNFATVPFIVGNAIHPDVTILNVYQNEFKEEYFKELQNYCRYKFGFDVNCFNIANTKYNINLENMERHIEYISLNNKYVLDRIPNELRQKCNLFNILNEGDEELLHNHILNILTENVSVLRYA